MPRTKKAECPHCKAKLDGATCHYDEAAVPRPGDFTVCIYCAGVSMFDENMNLVEGEPELDRTGEMVRKIQSAIKGIN